MNGIVYDIATGKVKYKFDTPGLPALNAGEAIKQRADINAIEVDAVYTPGTDTYENPGITSPDYKAQYAAAITDAQRIAVIAKKLELI